MFSSLVKNNRIRPEDFEQTSKGIRFTKEALDRFLVGYYGRMQQTFQHPTRNEKTTYLRAIELQVRHLARVITGEEAAYKPFLIPCLGKSAHKTVKRWKSQTFPSFFVDN